MNQKDSDQHSAPYYHAYYGDQDAYLGLDGEIILGSLPKKQSAFVRAWAMLQLLNEDDLTTNWSLAVNGEEILRIEPIK